MCIEDYKIGKHLYSRNAYFAGVAPGSSGEILANSRRVGLIFMGIPVPTVDWDAALYEPSTAGTRRIIASISQGAPTYEMWLTKHGSVVQSSFLPISTSLTGIMSVTEILAMDDIDKLIEDVIRDLKLYGK